jgi:hypothetical protein
VHDQVCQSQAGGCEPGALQPLRQLFPGNVPAALNRVGQDPAAPFGGGRIDSGTAVRSGVGPMEPG